MDLQDRIHNASVSKIQLEDGTVKHIVIMNVHSETNTVVGYDLLSKQLVTCPSVKTIQKASPQDFCDWLTDSQCFKIPDGGKITVQPRPFLGYTDTATTLTLEPKEVTVSLKFQQPHTIHKRTHTSGWCIQGMLQEEDGFVYVSRFLATHPTFGRLWGDCDRVVHADCPQAVSHFFQHHVPKSWTHVFQ